MGLTRDAGSPLCPIAWGGGCDVSRLERILGYPFFFLFVSSLLRATYLADEFPSQSIRLVSLGRRV